MTDDRPLPATLEEALDAGYKRYEALSEEVRDAIRDHDRDHRASLKFNGDPCGPGHTGPCSTLNYPGGVVKICYCNAAHQCDDCVFHSPDEP